MDTDQSSIKMHNCNTDKYIINISYVFTQNITGLNCNTKSKQKIKSTKFSIKRKSGTGKHGIPAFQKMFY